MKTKKKSPQKPPKYKPPYAVVDRHTRTMTFSIDANTFDRVNVIAKARDVTRGYLGRQLFLKALGELDGQTAQAA